MFNEVTSRRESKFFTMRIPQEPPRSIFILSQRDMQSIDEFFVNSQPMGLQQLYRSINKAAALGSPIVVDLLEFLPHRPRSSNVSSSSSSSYHPELSQTLTLSDSEQQVSL